jgi:hypothetical protein
MLGNRRSSIPSLLVVVSAAVAGGMVVVAVPPAGANDPILVTTTSDVVDAGDGQVSLREAVASANAAAGADEIVLLPEMTHSLTVCSAGGEGLELDGDEVTITGGDATLAVTCGSDGLDGDAGDTMVVTDLTITGADRAIFARGRAIELAGVSLVGNDIGLDAAGGGVTVDGSTFSDNDTAGMVLGNEPGFGNTYWLRTTTVAGNGADPTASLSAGGVSVESGLLFLASSTVTGNEGAVGGVAVDGEGNVFYSTIAGNTGTDVDELEIDTTAVIGQSIIGDDDDGSDNCLLGILPASAGSNIDADDSCGFHMTSDQVGVDPRLTPLADNGGPNLTRAPQFSSPALDAIPTCVLGTDQRGVARPQGGACDVGAVELDADQEFSDVQVSHPFFWEIDCIATIEIAEGYPDGTFRPTRTITRQAAIAWVWRLEGEPATSGPPTFPDVPPTHPFADAIAWAEQEGIAEGYGDGTFRPGRAVSRQAVAQWLFEAVGTFPITPAPFTDVPFMHPFIIPISWLAEAGITEGFPDNTFRPAASITRQALAAWLCRASELPTS